MQADGDEKRPWGTFETLGYGQRHKIARVTLQPGQRTSLHSHLYRREVLTVLQGQLRAVINGKTFCALEGQTLHVGYGEVHRLENAGAGPVVLSEVQYGSACQEQDHTRYADEYGRLLTDRNRYNPGEGVRSQMASAMTEQFIPEF